MNPVTVYVLISMITNTTLDRAQPPHVVGVYTDAAECLRVLHVPAPPGYVDNGKCEPTHLITSKADQP